MSMISWWESDKSCCLEYGKWSLGFNTYLSPIIITKFLTENDYSIKSFAPLTANSQKKEDQRHHVDKSYTWTWLELGDEGSMSENGQTLMSEFQKIAYQNVELIKVGLIERSIWNLMHFKCSSRCQSLIRISRKTKFKNEAWLFSFIGNLCLSRRAIQLPGDSH